MSSTNVPVTQAPPVAEQVAPSSDGGPATGSEATGGSPTSAPEPAPDDQVSTGLDEVAAAAVDLARRAAEEIAESDTVGEHLGVTVDEGGLTMHSFRCTARGYRGWRWAVTVAHVPGSDRVTVCDTVLLPGADSIVAPSWVPWSDRLAPGDLGAGDDLPYRSDDPYLVPGYTVTDEDDSDQQLFWELGLGRERVVGLEGLQAAAARWERGPHGPTSELAIQASAACGSCAYLVPVSGFLRRHFGVCANEWSPADGTVVTTDFGCGAHSETDLELPAPDPLPPHILDETVIEQVFVDRDAEPVESEPVESEPVESEPVESEPVESELVESEPVEVDQAEAALVEVTEAEVLPGEPVGAEALTEAPAPVGPVPPQPPSAETGQADVESLTGEPDAPEPAVVMPEPVDGAEITPADLDSEGRIRPFEVPPTP